jgi:sugar phosphate isomerase/epimerase
MHFAGKIWIAGYYLQIQEDLPLACADFSFSLLSHDLALDLIAGMGIGAIDVSLMLGNSHLHVEDVIFGSGTMAIDLAQKLSSKGLVIADLNFTPGPDFQNRALNHPDAEVRRESAKWFRHAVDFAVHVDAAHILRFFAAATHSPKKSRPCRYFPWR